MWWKQLLRKTQLDKGHYYESRRKSRKYMTGIENTQSIRVDADTFVLNDF